MSTTLERSPGLATMPGQAGESAPAPPSSNLYPLAYHLYMAPARRRIKRFVDLMLALQLLFTLLPVLLVIAVLVKITSPGPVFFLSPRIGRHGKLFMMVKFRTMVHDADRLRSRLRVENRQEHELFKIKEDPRITGFGRFLREYSLDELPQIFNVIRGQMSLVGPRPFAPDDSALFQPPYTARYLATPGMTGLWQVSGRSLTNFKQMCELDMTYLRQWSLRYDAWILFRTIPVVLFKHGAL